jgi:hypothetical protein
MRIRLVRGITFLYVGVPAGEVYYADKEYYFSSIALPLKQIHIFIVEYIYRITNIILFRKFMMRF